MHLIYISDVFFVLKKITYKHKDITLTDPNNNMMKKIEHQINIKFKFEEDACEPNIVNKY